MAIVDLNEMANNTLDGSNLMLVLGVPKEKVELDGTIGGSPENDEFVFPGPIYPKSGRTIKPIGGDVTVYARKNGSPATDTEVAVTSILTGTDDETGYTVYNTAKLTTAPTSETADKVLADFVEYHDLYVEQSLKPKEDQDTSDIAQLGSKTIHTKYGKIKTSIEVECILADLKPILLSHEEAEDQTGVESGYTLYERRDNPRMVYGYIPIFNEDEREDPIDRSEVARIYLESVKIPPSLPEAKANDDVTVKIELTIGAKPKILVLNEA